MVNSGAREDKGASVECATDSSRQVRSSLTVQSGPQAGRCFLMKRETYSIGSSPGSDVVLKGSQVARHHAAVTLGEACWTLHDLNSLSGTYVNGQRIKAPYPLVEGDVVGLGGEVFLAFLQQGRPFHLSVSQSPGP